MTQEKLTFTGESGDQLAGRLDIPDEGEPRGYVLFAHCFTGSKDVLAAVRIAKALFNIAHFKGSRRSGHNLGSSTGLPQQQQMNSSCVCAAGAKKGAILSGLRQMRVLYQDDIGLGT